MRTFQDPRGFKNRNVILEFGCEMSTIGSGVCMLDHQLVAMTGEVMQPLGGIALWKEYVTDARF